MSWKTWVHKRNGGSVSIRVVRTAWGNDFQYHAITADENGVEVRRSPAPEWAYALSQQLEDQAAGVEKADGDKEVFAKIRAKLAAIGSRDISPEAFAVVRELEEWMREQE